MTRPPHDTETTKAFNAKVADEFRANNGKVGGAFEGNELLLLTTVGAKSAVRRRVPWRTVVGEDSAVVACCACVEHGAMMGRFVVVDPGPTLVPVSL